MGAGESKPGSASNVGLHVLRVAERSPSQDANLEPFFDHIVGYNGQAMTEDTDAFMHAVETAERKRQYMTLQVWSSKREELRHVQILPSRNWSVSTKSVVTHEDAQPSLLGLSLRLCNPEGALDQVWHILDILEGSPAQAAGLVSYGDYIIGYNGGVLRGEGDFYNLVEEHENRSLRLFVYNADFDVTREVVIVPNRDWGTGDSLLGCGVGYGLLHRIPKPQDRPSNPTELNEEESREELESFDATAGVSVVDTSASSTFKSPIKNTIATPSRNVPLQPTHLTNQASSGRVSPSKFPPASPSSRSNRNRNSIAETLIEE